ncbi:Tuberin [Lucilia cuprina]|nr:Tuberin [Lucilia cuprina]
MREQFFLVIQNHEVPEDLKHRLELLETLTENGKDIKNLEEKIGRFMLQWLGAIHQANLLVPYLNMLVNLIKFNAAHLDNEIIIGIVTNACNLSCSVSDEVIGIQCLSILEMVMSYTIFPSDPLPQFVFTLCRTVNIPPYCQASWKIMKNLLGTELGYHSMKMMCNILNDRTLDEDNFLLRGAVFHLNMNIFGAPMVFQVSPLFYASMVLNSFLRALDSRHVSVTYEVIIGIYIVITKYKSELPEIIWDRICDIMSAIVDNIEYYESFSTTTDSLLQLKNHLHENITFIEKLLEDDKTKILANYERIYDLIERVAESRPESSVLLLIDYRSSKITATRPEWLLLLNTFVQRFYKMTNTPIRIKVIQSLVNIMDLNRSCYEEEILERVVIPLFTHVCNETDVQLRRAVADALIDFTRHCDTKRCGELLDILEKIINRPYDMHKQYGTDIKTEQEIQDVITAVDGLIEVFVIKLYRLPSCHAIKIFNILVGHLELHYQYPKVFEQVNIVRYKIFCWMLRARANASYHIGYPDPTNNDNIKFSYYLGIDSNLPVHDISHHHQRHSIMSQSNHDIVPNAHFTTISIKRACETIVKCLEKDRDFQIFQLVIKELPKVMQNKALIQGNDIESLAAALFKTISESNKALHVVYKCTIDELNSLVLPAIAGLVIYHQYLQPSNQYKIIEVLKMGISNIGSGIATIATICINTMTTIILEMPEALMRKLPDILLQMSKMSDTPTVAIPVLDFLSILSRLSNDLCTNFTSRQYMYVFAISLPYTKPRRYHHYVVSLAHHVIAGWFLKCKLELRRNCVNYIINSIQSNASMLYEDINNLTRNVQIQDFQSLNEDSSNRKRSTSLTERGSRNTAAATARNHSEMRPLMNEGLKSFHAELAETCIDFLARHTFSPCSALPKRLPAVEYLLKDGHSQTWLVGHNLVTITTSGCPSGPTRNGLCDRCAQLGKAYTLSPKNSTDTNPGTTPISPEINHTQGAPTYEHRYTKVSLQHSSGNESAGSTDLTSSSSSTSHTTQRQTSNSSTASLEALSRRGSNPEAGSTDLGVGSTAGGVGGGSCSSLLGNSLSSSSVCASPICVRSCTAWAEILIRRPTGNISWITRIQNPLSNDCFGYDVPFSSMVSLFLPTQHGGVFGPDFLQPENLEEINAVSKEIKETVQNENLKHELSMTKSLEERPKTVSKARALQRQEEISSSAQAVAGTQAIDIPKLTTAGKRGKEALCGSVSDGEADEEYLAIEGGQMRARKPVRRVNSSPEMSSSWRNTFLMNKPAPLSQETAGATELTNDFELPAQHQQQSQQQKKKSVQYSKVSCEAIPEEIAGSTPPQQSNKSDATLKAPETLTLPPKQLSADDVSQKTATTQPLVQQSASATSLKSTGTGAQGEEKIVAKPPLSPAPQHSPRMEKQHAPAIKSTSFGYHQGLAKSSSGGNNSNMSSSQGGQNQNNDYNNGEMRGRSKTISVVREVNNGKSRPPTTAFSRFGATKPQLNTKLCMNPSFVFMQLYHTGQVQVTDVPIKVPPEQMSAVNLLDLAPPFETHNIGVLYVGQGQCNNVVEILRNSHGSTRYVEFLRSIGTLVSLKDAAQNNLFVTLATDGADGKFTYIWKDDIVQVTFHVATLMPTKLNSDPNCNEKKKHIGNDYVNIVYNESGEEYNLNTISGQFSYACVIVEPLELNTNRIYVKARPEIADFVCHPGPKIVSDKSAPLLARQLALHANLASNVYQSLQKKNPYASNWLERLRSIKRLRTKLLENQNRGGSTAANADIDDKQNTNRDFSKYT